MRSTGGVRMGEGASELLGRQQRWGDGDQAGFLKPRRAMIEHGHDGGPGVRGLGEPFLSVTQSPVTTRGHTPMLVALPFHTAARNSG